MESAPPETDTKKPSLSERLKVLIAEYGLLAFGIYLCTTVLVYGGTAAAMQMGFTIDGAAGTAGMLGAGWAIAKLTQAPRILLTLMLTPLVARLLRKAPKSEQGVLPPER